MSRSFCFSCGREMQIAVGDDVAALCAVCEARYGGRTAPTYNVRPRQGEAMGPLSREQVIDQIMRGAVGPEDRISESGDAAVRVDHHPHFLACFVADTEQSRALEDARGEWQRKQSGLRRDAAMAPVKRLVRLVTILGTPLVVFIAVDQLVPQESKDAAVAGLRGAWDAAVARVQHAVDEEAAMEGVRTSTEVPGAELLAALAEKHPQIEAGGVALLEQGWAQLLMGTRAGVEQARISLEQALVRMPDSADIASALAITYTILARGDDTLNQASVTLLERSRLIQEDQRPYLRAQAGVAAASGAWVQGMESARACLKLAGDDARCLWYLGRSQSGLGAHNDAIASLTAAAGALPDAAGVTLSLAQARLAAGDAAAAMPVLKAHAAANPQDADVRTALAVAMRDMGQFGEALSWASQAAALDPGQLRARALQGVLTLYIQGNAAGAYSLLAPLEQEENFRRLSDWRTIMVHASHAARRSGRPEEALRLAELALQNQVANAPARAAQAMAYMALGDNDGVEEALRIAETGDLDWLERARFSYTAGWFFRSLKRGTAARDAFAEAVTEAPEWAPATAAMAMTYLEADNPVQAADTLNKLLDEDLHRISRRDPVPDIPVNEINLGEIAAAMRAAFQGDERLNARLPRVEGILHAMRCLEGQRERCGTAQARLQAALNNDEADHVAHAFLGRIALISGDWGAAVNHFDRVLARQDDIAIILAMKGRALYALGRTAEAESAFKKAYNAASEMPGIYFHHAEALLAAGDRDGARQRYRTVVRLDPRDVTSRGRLLALGS